MMTLLPVVMCGGSGTRLWPVSRRDHPKQFVRLFDRDGGANDGGTGGKPPRGETLFRLAMDRVARLDCRRAIVVCNHAHRFFVADGLRASEREACAILVEPHQRNTAPAAMLAALSAREQCTDALLLLMPSDHVIADPDAFVRAVADATEAAKLDNIVVFGVAPGRAETGYGYIRAHRAQPPAPGAARKVAAFCEKPDRATAAEWLARGDCYWNSGIFLMKASVYLRAVERFEPGIREACERAWEKRHDDLGFTYADADSFARCRNISIDYAVIERAENVMMVPADMGWSDLGGWNALGEVFAADADNNRVRGDVLLRDAAGNIVHGHDKLVTVLGVDDCIVVDTPDAVLVAARERAADIGQLVAGLRQRSRPEADRHRKVFRPWGYYECLNKAENFQVKRIVVNPGHGLSLQLHRRRSEHWVVVKGEARVTRGDQVFTLTENQSTYIPAGMKHRLENVHHEPVRLIEVQCGDYLEEDDIIRLDDRYGRAAQ